MGSITFSVTHDVSGTKSRTFTVADANISRLITWAQGQFGGNVAQALSAWAGEVIDQTRTRVIESEKVAAALAAQQPFDVS